MSSVKQAIVEMITTYHELNGPVEELRTEPSPLIFMRYVAKNKPFIVRQGCSTWTAVQKWNATYLQNKMGSFPVRIAVTPDGLAWSLIIE